MRACELSLPAGAPVVLDLLDRPPRAFPLRVALVVAGATESDLHQAAWPTWGESDPA